MALSHHGHPSGVQPSLSETARLIRCVARIQTKKFCHFQLDQSGLQQRQGPVLSLPFRDGIKNHKPLPKKGLTNRNEHASIFRSGLASDLLLVVVVGQRNSTCGKRNVQGREVPSNPQSEPRSKHKRSTRSLWHFARCSAAIWESQ